jgi:type IV secretion system protein TrbF
MSSTTHDTPDTARSPNTPSFVEAARREFAGVFGDLARGKRNWQVMAFALAGVLAIVVLAYVRLAASTRLVPYVVEVDRLGQVVGAGAAEPMRSPDDRLIASQLAQFVRNLRTVLPLAAASAQAEMVRRGYAFVAPEAAGFLNDYFARPDNDPRVLGARITRRVDITSVLRVPGSGVWTVRWSEAEAPVGSDAPTRTTAWEAYVAAKVVPPSTMDGLQDNPLGLYVTSITWTPTARGEHPRGETP